MVLFIKDRIGVGQFADVLATNQPAVLCKLYRAAGSDSWRRWASRVRDAEAQAYQIASNHPVLCNHVPKFYGIAVVSAVLEGTTDRSKDYLLDTGLLIERVEGEEEKATGLSRRKFPHIYRLADLFDEAGIDIGDSSAFNYADPDAVKFIDILTHGGSRILCEVA